MRASPGLATIRIVEWPSSSNEGQMRPCASPCAWLQIGLAAIRGRTGGAARGFSLSATSFIRVAAASPYGL